MKKKNSSEGIVAKIQSYLHEHDEDSALSDVVEKLQSIMLKTQAAKEIVVTSAVPMTENELKTLTELLSSVVRKDLPVVNRLDPALLAGFTVRIHDWFLDASMVSQLTDIKRRLLA